MTESFLTLPSPEIALEKLRRDTIPDADFSYFCKQLTHVLVGKRCRTDLQRSIRFLLDDFYDADNHSGNLSVHRLVEYLRDLAECGSLFRHRSMATGTLEHIWYPEYHKWHPWLAKFEDVINNGPLAEHDRNPFPTIELLTRGGSFLDRLKAVELWALQAQVFLDDEDDGRPDILPILETEIINFPLQLRLTCLHADREDDVVELKLMPLPRVGAYCLQLSWRIASGRVSHFLGIPYLMAAANRCDEVNIIDPVTKRPGGLYPTLKFAD